ncbi:MAG: hypothetical protein EXS22_01710 [Pedosphaera sp.]|nr:hypothetical protein [Pedosphaera sp.]MSU42742.1 hypothetical protein [Pedosphaera sp.]
MQLIRELRNTAPLGKVEWLLEISTDECAALGIKPNARNEDPARNATMLELAIDSLTEEFKED